MRDNEETAWADAAAAQHPASALTDDRDRTRFGRLALVGNPNVGKSVIFGALTGTYATVSNYPGTTVEVSRAPARAAGQIAAGVELIDTPGVNSLTPSSEDERVTRDILLEGVDGVIQVADAKNLARALIISLQLAEARIPFVLVLNMMDEAADRGLHIDTTKLSAVLGVPVLQTVAVSGRGLSELGAALGAATASHYRARYSVATEHALTQIEPLLTGFEIAARGLASMCVAGDQTLGPWLARNVAAPALHTIEDVCRNLQTQLRRPAGYQLNRVRVHAAQELAQSVTRVVTSQSPLQAPETRAWTAIALAAFGACLMLLAGDLHVLPVLQHPAVRALGWLTIGAALLATDRRAEMRVTLGRYASQPGTGFAVLLVVLYIVYQFVGVLAAGTGVDFLEKRVFGGWINPLITGGIDNAIAAVAPAAGLGATAMHLLRDALVGPYGMVTIALTYALAIILPIVTSFFLVFSILEDSGYLPRLAVIVNRGFRAMGLSGKAVLPMVLGLGCDTMATLTARIMETRKERILVTLLLALGVPCSAQLGVILGLFGALPMWAPLVWGGVVVGVLFIVGFLAAQLLPGERSDLILEIPPIRRPQLSNIILKTMARLEWYVKEAVPVFILGTFVLFVLDATGILARVVSASEPAIVGMLSLPAKAAEAFLIGFFRRDYGSAGIYALFQQGQLAPVQAVVALITITLFVPCVANFFVIVKEHGLAIAVAMSAFIFPFAFAVGSAVNLGLRAVGLQ